MNENTMRMAANTLATAIGIGLAVLLLEIQNPWVVVLALFLVAAMHFVRAIW